MRPWLAAVQHQLIGGMTVDGTATYAQFAKAAECCMDAVKTISANLRRFCSTTAPQNRADALATSVSRFIRGLKYAAISSDWKDMGLAGAHSLDLEGINLDPLVKLLEQQIAQIERRQRVSGSPSKSDLLDLAYDFRDKLSTDVRDKVYALVGIAEIRGLDPDSELRPDYTKPFHEVTDDLRQLLLQATVPEDTVSGDPASGTTSSQDHA